MQDEVDEFDKIEPLRGHTLMMSLPKWVGVSVIN